MWETRPEKPEGSGSCPVKELRLNLVGSGEPQKN